MIKGITLALHLFVKLANAEVIIVTGDTQYAQTIAKKIQGGIHKDSAISSSITKSSSSDIVIAIGHEAFMAARAKNKSVMVGTFINFADTRDIESSFGPEFTIYSDPSPKRLAHFINENLSNTRIGYLYTKNDKLFVDQTKNLIASNNQLVAIPFEQDTFEALKKVIDQKIDIMLVGRNREIYNPNNIRFVLESLFRKKVPVIATSTLLLKAGAAIAIAPPEEVIINETCNLVNGLLRGHKPVNTAFFIDDIEVKTNSSLMELYNLQLGGHPTK